MRVAVVQHRLRETAEADALAFGDAARAAAARNAGFIIFPEVFSLDGGPVRDRMSRIVDEHIGGRPYLIPHVGPDTRAMAFATAQIPGVAESLGTVALLVGDACIDPARLHGAAASEPDVLVLVPRSESDLQAEAVLELAIGLSESVAGLVLVVDAIGGEPGEVGHGGSAIISVGEVLAEAVADEELLVAEIGEPAPQPVSRQPVPPVPPILLQRLAHHEGRVPEVDYPADLS
jgi:hypothetical protein